MTKQTINIGAADNDGTGDSIRHSFDLANQNFTELYNLINGGDGVHFLNLVDTPKILIPSTSINPVVLISSDVGSTVTQSTLVAGYGIEIKTANTLTNSSAITIALSTSTGLYNFNLASDANPTLGNDLDGMGFAATNFADPFNPSDLVTKQYFDDNVPLSLEGANTLYDVDTAQWRGGSSALARLNHVVIRNNVGDIYVNDVHSLKLFPTEIVATGDVSIGGEIAAIGNITSSGDMYATVFHGEATSARYADLAENYLADAVYGHGTVLIFGGNAEVTASKFMMDRRVAGVVSTNPAHLMNSMQEGGTPVALTGRAPCKVVGKVRKGDMLVTSNIEGVAMASDDPKTGAVIGKSLENYNSSEVGVIEVAIGRV